MRKKYLSLIQGNIYFCRVIKTVKILYSRLTGMLLINSHFPLRWNYDLSNPEYNPMYNPRVDYTMNLHPDKTIGSTMINF